MNHLLFLIEGGRPLELVQQHLAEKERVRLSNLEICNELGITRAYCDHTSGVIRGAVFATPDSREGWKKADRKGVSFPKKGSEWFARLAAQVGYEDPAALIAKELGVPTSLGYKEPNGKSEGWRMLGNPFRACGFLWISPEGPFAMWIPDVPGEVAKSKAEGYLVEEPANSFKPEFPGCKPMLEEEWNFLCADHDLKHKQQSLAKAA